MRTSIDGYHEFLLEIRDAAGGQFSRILAYGVLCEGRLMAIGPEGVQWLGSYSINGQSAVLDLVIDRSDADRTLVLLDTQGRQVDSSAQYHFELPISQDDGDLMMGGAVTHDAVSFEVVVTRKMAF